MRNTAIKLSSNAQTLLNHFYTWTTLLTAFFLPLSTTITDVLFLFCAFFFFATGQIKLKITHIAQQPALLGMVLFFVWALFGLTYTHASLQEALLGLHKYDKLLLGVFFVPVFVHEKWRRYALHAFLMALAITMLVALLRAFHFLEDIKGYEPLLIFKDRIQTSFLAAFSAYVSMILFFEPTSPRWLKWIYFLFFLCSTFFLFSTDGRSGYIVFFVLLIWFLWHRWKLKGLLIAASISIPIILSAYLFSPAFDARLAEVKHDRQVYQAGNHDTSLGLRFEFVKNSFKLIEQHPFFGAGTGSFSEEYRGLNPSPDLITHNPHNQYAHVLVQWGVFGLLLLLTLFFVQWRESLKLPPLRGDLTRGIILSIVIGSLANSWLLDTTEGHLYVYLMALGFA